MYVSRRVKSPCLQCQSRRVGCHSICKEYQNFQEKNNSLKKLVLQKKTEEYDLFKSLNTKTVYHMYKG